MEIIGGTYQGQFGWKHLSSNTFPNKAWIIVERSASHAVEKARLLLKTNFVDLTPETEEESPDNFEIALLKDHRDIKADMHNLAKKLATFRDYPPSQGKNMMMILWSMWDNESRKLANARSVPNARFVLSWQAPPVQNVNVNSNSENVGTPNTTGTENMSIGGSLSLPDYDQMWEGGNVVSDDEEEQRNARREAIANAATSRRNTRNRAQANAGAAGQ